eukprot:9473154-Pyramimonas_sp.AAC.1
MAEGETQNVKACSRTGEAKMPGIQLQGDRGKAGLCAEAVHRHVQVGGPHDGVLPPRRLVPRRGLQGLDILQNSPP